MLDNITRQSGALLNGSGVAAMLIAVFLFADAWRPATAKEFVDLELVLAVDVSLSMDADEQRLQREGYVAAFRDPSLINAIKDGPNGRIAVTYVEWAGSHIQSVIVPWKTISTSDEANAFADALAQVPPGRALMTSISEVLLLSARMIEENKVQGLRRVIDVSGDGPNNSGNFVEDARDLVVQSGVVVNGLAIQIKQGGGLYSYFDLPDLDRYYKDCVIGGSGAFVLSIRDKREIGTAIRQKLLLEIAGIQPPLPARLWRAQLANEADKYDCLIGEKLWQQYQRNRDDDSF